MDNCRTNGPGRQLDDRGPQQDPIQMILAVPKSKTNEEDKNRHTKANRKAWCVECAANETGKKIFFFLSDFDWGLNSNQKCRSEIALCCCCYDLSLLINGEPTTNFSNFHFSVPSALSIESIPLFCVHSDTKIAVNRLEVKISELLCVEEENSVDRETFEVEIRENFEFCLPSHFELGKI